MTSAYDELYFGGETMDILYVILTALLVVAAVTHDDPEKGRYSGWPSCF